MEREGAGGCSFCCDEQWIAVGVLLWVWEGGGWGGGVWGWVCVCGGGGGGGGEVEEGVMLNDLFIKFTNQKPVFVC